MSGVIVFLLIVHLVAALVLLVSSAAAIHAMKKETAHFIRIGYVFVCVGAFAALAYPFFFYDWRPTPDTLVMMGAAVLLAANKRSALVSLGRDLISPLRQ